jgi:hypothetical protein
VCAEARAILRAVAADFFVNCRCVEIPIPVFGTYQGASTIMRKAFHWKRSRFYMLESREIKVICTATAQSINFKVYFRYFHRHLLGYGSTAAFYTFFRYFHKYLRLNLHFVTTEDATTS